MTQRKYNQELDRNDKKCLITVKDYKQQIKDRSITSDDGFGYWVKENKKSDESCNEYICSLDATHVVWYNN